MQYADTMQSDSNASTSTATSTPNRSFDDQANTDTASQPQVTQQIQTISASYSATSAQTPSRVQQQQQSIMLNCEEPGDANIMSSISDDIDVTPDTHIDLTQLNESGRSVSTIPSQSLRDASSISTSALLSTVQIRSEPIADIGHIGSYSLEASVPQISASDNVEGGFLRDFSGFSMNLNVFEC